MTITQFLQGLSPFPLKVASAWETIDPAKVLEFMDAFGYERTTDETWGVETVTIDRGQIKVTLRKCGEAFDVMPSFRGAAVCFAEAVAVLGAELWNLKEAARTLPLN